MNPSRPLYDHTERRRKSRFVKIYQETPIFIFAKGVPPGHSRQTKSYFTRTHDQQTLPLPHIRASQIVAPKKKDKDQPDLKEAMEASDSGVEIEEDKAPLSDEEPLDIEFPKGKKSAAAT